MATFDKINFVGGINQQADASRVDVTKGEYYLLMNGRTRRNVVRPIHNPRNITGGLPTDGVLQGAYAINSYQIVFVNGKAYWKNFDPEGAVWNLVAGLQMSPTADRVWLELVPASTVNFKRTPTDADDKKSAVKLGANVSGSPQCAIVMDGVSQSWIIFPDATARITQNFAQWTPENPEYVPIARFPRKIGSKLYCIGPDANGVFNQLFHSVSGAYLNFMVPISSTGGKISNNELESGAPAVAERVDFGETTALQRINATNDAFFSSTVQNSHLVIPDYENKIFGEPTFIKQFLFNVGALNQECVVDLLGNTALIHFAGIRDFNAILNQQNEGRNSPLSQSINDLVADIAQTYGATISYDNFAVFAIRTRYGPAVVWYDTLLQRFVSVDVLENVRAEIKQFSSVLTRTVRKLFFITSDNQLYEYDADPTVATCRLYIKDFVPQDNGSEHAIVDVRTQFGVVRSAGKIQATVYADDRRCGSKAANIEVGRISDNPVDPIPYSTAPQEQGLPIGFSFVGVAAQAWKTGVLLEWNADADLLALSISTQESGVSASEQTKAGPYISIEPEKIIMVGNDGEASSGRIALNKRIKLEKPTVVLGLGNHAYDLGSFSDYATKFTPYWGQYRKEGRFFAVPGSADLSSDLGEPFYQTVNQGPTRYSFHDTDNARFFLVNSGYATPSLDVERDNTDGLTLAQSTQFRWLKAHLSLTEGKFRFVLWAHPPYSSAGDYAALQQPPIRQWGAHALFSATHGLFERLYVNSLPYYVAGTGSPSRLLTELPAARDGSYYRSVELGYIRLLLYPLSAVVEYVNSEGEVLDVSVISR